MKILFVYPGYIVREVPLNIMYVSAAVKACGHDSRLFHFSPYHKPAWLKSAADRIEEGFKQVMAEYKPDLVGFSVMIQDYIITKRLSDLSRNYYKVLVIWGGIEPILEPEKCIKEPEVDFICTGEGEVVFPEFLQVLDSNRNPMKIKGIWGKNSRGNIIKNDRPELIRDLDSLPFPDRELLEYKYYQAELTGANLLSSRGCPFPCTFCQNQTLMEIYRNKGKFLRNRSIENIIKEMEDMICRYNVSSFYLSDEAFTLDKNRVFDFCREYRSKIKRPFMIQTRVDLVDKELARELSDAGCFMVNMSIENGNEYIRNRILNKNFSKEQIIRAYSIIRDNGMMASSFNMIGAPGESIHTIWETIDINRQLKPNRILCTIFMPLPGTELWEECKKNELMEDWISETTNYYSQVIIKNPNLSAATLIGYQGFFDWYVLLPRWLYGFVHLLRITYQICVSPRVPKNPVKAKLREFIVETVYQLKRFLPQKKLHVKIR